MRYDFACDGCRITTEVERPMAQASDLAACPVCGESMRRLLFPPAVMNRQKPGTAERMLDAKRKAADGTANTFYALRAAEQRGGDHWRKVKSQTLSSELRQMRTYKQQNGL